MDEIDEKLFASLKGVWTEEEKEEARSFYDVGGTRAHNVIRI